MQVLPDYTNVNVSMVLSEYIQNDRAYVQVGHRSGTCRAEERLPLPGLFLPAHGNHHTLSSRFNMNGEVAGTSSWAIPLHKIAERALRMESCEITSGQALGWQPC